MKKLVVNRESHPSVFVGCKNLGQLIDWVENEGEKEDLFIVKIELNDRKVDNDEENLLYKLSINEVQELKVDMMTVNELMSNTMMSVITLMQDLQVKCIEYSTQLRAAMEFEEQGIKEIFAKSRMVIDSLEEIFQVHINEKFKLRHFSLWKEAEKELSSILQCILQAFELKDAKFVSEMLESEFPDALLQWEEVLEKEILDNPSVARIFNLNSHAGRSDNEVDV